MSEKKLDLILEELKKINGRLDSQEQTVSQLIGIVKSTNEKVSAIQEDTTLLKENQQTVLHIQQEQQKVLERLSIRSISQEADIAELRRVK